MTKPIKGLLIASTITLVLCAAGALFVSAVTGTAVHGVQQDNADRIGDVKISSCERSVIDTVEVSYVIVNSSTTPRSYLLEFEAVTKDGVRIGVANGFENDVPGLGTAKGKAAGTIAEKGSFSCRLVGA